MRSAKYIIINPGFILIIFDISIIFACIFYINTYIIAHLIFTIVLLRYRSARKPGHIFCRLMLLLFMLSISFPLLADNTDIDIRKEIGFNGYYYEVSFEIPEMNIEQLESRLASETFLESIPYYSRYNDTTSILYKNVDFVNNSINVTLQPFNPFLGKITKFKSPNTLEWYYTNTEAVKLGWIKVISMGNLNNKLLAVQKGNTLQITGEASLKTFPFLFLFGKRIEWAIEGRILAMFYALAEPGGARLSSISE